MANPKKTKYGYPSNWSTVYASVPAATAVRLATAKANALPRGKQYQLGKNGFTHTGQNRYSFTHNGRTANLVYSFSLGGWNCACPEIELTHFFDRHVPAAEIRATLTAVLGGPQ